VQTARDQEIVGWIARIGAAGAEHLRARFGVGRSQAYARLSALSRDGLLEQNRLLHRTPGLYVATAEGLRWTGQERLGVQRLSAGSFQHAWGLGSTAVALPVALPDWRQLSERELRALEVDQQRRIASVALAELPVGYYGPSSRIFVGSAQNEIRTVITDARPKYIENLKAARP
jgi:hypothetical protein